ncbi:MAG: hypothetical protein NE330_14780 [Lentisphaeraceae bacterium]|nr:hypothetical protein [Lentisphaeraceae bacterium]
MRFLAVLFLLTFIVSAEEVSVESLFTQYISGLTSSEKHRFEDIDRLQKSDSLLFDKKLTVRCFRKGILLAYGKKVEGLILTQPSPKQKPGLVFSKIYKNRKGKKNLGAPLEGPYTVFKKNIKYHIYEKGLIIIKMSGKKRPIELVLLEKPFDVKF